MRILHVAASVTLAIVPLALGSTVIACPNGRFGTCIDQWSSSWSVDRTLRRHWTSVITPGARLDQARGEVQIVEFSDYECAACRVAYLSITRVVDSGRGPGIVYRHFPLPGNAMASEAARASICAEQQGRFHAMHALLFERNEWRSGTTWSREATAAGMPDLRAFAECLQSAATTKRLEADATIADRLRIRSVPAFATPSGVRLRLSPAEIEQLIRGRE